MNNKNFEKKRADKSKNYYPDWNKDQRGVNMFPIGKEGEFPCGSDSKESACNEGDPSSIPGSG